MKKICIWDDTDSKNDCILEMKTILTKHNHKTNIIHPRIQPDAFELIKERKHKIKHPKILSIL